MIGVPSPALAGEGQGGGASSSLLPQATTLRILSDGRAGHEAQTLGLAEALGVAPEIRCIASRNIYAALAPFAPADPRDAFAHAPPYPDIAIGAGRRTIPALKRLKRDSGGRTFTVYLNKPANGLSAADLIIAPRHDGLRGANVFSPLTPANRLTPERLAAARAAPNPRIAALPRPRVALIVGGDSRRGAYGAKDIAQLAHIAASLRASGRSVMATASRRTPMALRDALTLALAAPGGFFWNSAGDNPYLSMLAIADAIVVTGDSVNMVGEAVATAAPVYVVPPPGRRGKIDAYLTALADAGAIRIWSGALEDWRRAPVNATPDIARAVTLAYLAFAGARP
ncbi:mitochondrial fission ELM1 family protein [Methylocystis rosea]|uniref:mitochondrial fission ELM1 family protein n=1 Tax=Methylocystis rosea TaxID=173366 RepID=UPI0003647FEB|nr:mitochondrial fission ELM1 family protein [Methylocystis rosea]